MGRGLGTRFAKCNGHAIGKKRSASSPPPHREAGSDCVVSPAAAEGLRNDQVAMLTHTAGTDEVHPPCLDWISIAIGTMRDQIHVAKLQLIAAAFANGLLGFDRLIACYPDSHDPISLQTAETPRVLAEIGIAPADTRTVGNHARRAVPLEKVRSESAAGIHPDHHALRRTGLPTTGTARSTGSASTAGTSSAPCSPNPR